MQTYSFDQAYNAGLVVDNRWDCLRPKIKRTPRMTTDVKQMTTEEIHDRIIQLGFANDRQCFERFCQKLREALPPGTAVVLRGSVVTN